MRITLKEQLWLNRMLICIFQSWPLCFDLKMEYIFFSIATHIVNKSSKRKIILNLLFTTMSNFIQNILNLCVPFMKNIISIRMSVNYKDNSLNIKQNSYIARIFKSIFSQRFTRFHPVILNIKQEHCSLIILIQQLVILMYLEASQYHVLSNLGCGSEHMIYKVENRLNSEVQAIKIEKSPGIGQIANEIVILKKLKGTAGIPALISYGVTPENKSFLIIPLLHCNLGDIAKRKQLSLPQILRIGLRITEILEKVHDLNILHLDIKPENIMISSPLVNDSKILQPDLIQLIDFGLSQEIIRNSKLLKDVFIGSLNFASRQSHKGEQLGYKDDLESLLYVLVFLRNSTLPWFQKPSWGCREVDIKVIGRIKSFHFNSTSLTQNFPLQFQEIMSYIDSLKYNILPDYGYLKSLFMEMIKKPQCSVFQINQVFESQNEIETSILIDNSNENNKDDMYSDQEDMISFETKNFQICKIIGKYFTNSIKSISDIKS
ncbi:unnamed protein product [Paramecium octaurelia]|uniref:Casein kinase I n=1 Tax=Paramecium octaurelia TaxID=43137 RepID=A0A8S1Y115_PAROT|nr:unnamed protein product [Paramecium octaurelia]